MQHFLSSFACPLSMETKSYSNGIHLLINVAVSFPVAMRQCYDRGKLWEKAFAWLTIPAFSPSWKEATA